MIRTDLLRTILLPLALAAPAAAQGMSDQFSQNPVADWLGGNTRFALDFAYRGTLPSTTGKPMGLGAIGFDLHRVFSDDTRDIGTLTAQGYLLRFDNATMRPGFVEGEEDWDWTWRILTFNYTGLSDGSFNIKAGHIEMPFGLEWTFDSNGTIRNYQLRPNLGLMLDWGVGINGVLPEFDYEITVTRGSGMEFRDTGDPYAVCGRVGTPGSRQFVIGLSGFHGEVVSPGPLVERTRVAVDVQQQVGAWTLLGELSTGDDDGDARTQTIAEVNWVNQDETMMLYLQDVGRWQERGGSTDSANRLGLGVLYRPDGRWDVSAELRQDLEAFRGADRTFTFVAQLRYRF
ncbi:MAG: hypothetical protein KAI24_10410 [Planctomycetes bacterium]|nr:hypothetical protein [Planctomycetota bacterium]